MRKNCYVGRFLLSQARSLSMSTIHLAPIGAQYTGALSHDGRPIADRIIAEPKVMLCGLGLPLTRPIEVAVPHDHPRLCVDCMKEFPNRKGSLRPLMYV